MSASTDPIKPTKKGGMSFTAKVILWTCLSFVAGGLSGLGFALTTDFPFYFGFFFGWVLIGLVGLFVLAAHVGEQQEQARLERLREINRGS